MLDDLAVAHHGDFVGEVSGHGEVVGDEEKGCAERGLEFEKEIGDLRLNRAIESGEGFVENENFGLERERAGDGQPLALAAA